MDQLEASEMVGALEMLKCLTDELNHLYSEYMKHAKQREANVCTYILQNLVIIHANEIAGKLEIMKSELIDKSN